MEGSAMTVRGTTTGGVDSQPKGYSSGLKSEPGWSKSPKMGSRDPIVCNYCRKPYHTKDRCWKLRGKPSIDYGWWGLIWCGVVWCRIGGCG